MRLWIVLLLFLCVGCGRPLTPTEQNYLQGIHGPSLDTSKVRLVRIPPLRSFSLAIPKRPRVTCQDRIFPPPTEEIVTGAPAATVIFNRIFVNRDYYLPNYIPGYPNEMYLYEAMLLAHEMTHIWQWQNRDITGYHPFKAVAEHRASADPYLFDLGDSDAQFSDFGYEQQGAIVEEFVCCRALDPDGARTARLRELLEAAFGNPSLVARLPNTNVIKPWDGADVEAVCS
ncbi:hypothetical protein [Litoreibacter roseus]|uniref:DUF4157 domain-containing protein n=1 Tax=Litoreibacter roseus TaxID=2601869 RepID=A0A6N6JIR9_9RHOB|nr:hypothetical protein [Litoreibacter roseus]GFE66014.1 hypothetical protein KIN_30880 [Litoreibacter roseus]